ncbi:SGNH/GDSL hydrolase family protein [uncultured Shewanella sp.]|uniref:SGNH/GDSL hydrolase family protein n=1 Tax=uncultured Shewanella sp. TaxID=173975 RepID=UPI0026081E29|nr:SGNH/GDSL hydrolase family protein [uncultured Shewanella sp.]
MMNIFSYLLFFFISPVLFVQAWYVRKVTPKLPEPTGIRSGVSGKGESMNLLIIGDSAAAGVGVDTQSQALLGQTVALLNERARVNWSLCAQSGFSTKDILDRLKTIKKQDIDVVLISLGVNDVTRFIRVKTWLKQQQALLDFCRNEFSSRQVLFSLVPPMGDFPALPQPLAWCLGLRSQAFNECLANWLSQEADCQIVDLGTLLDASQMAADGFHPGEAIYHHWAKIAVEKMFSNQ